MGFFEILFRIYVFLCSGGLFAFVIYTFIKEPFHKTLIKEIEQKWDHSNHDAAPIINYIFKPLFNIFGTVFIIFLTIITPLSGIMFSLNTYPNIDSENLLLGITAFSAFLVIYCYQNANTDPNRTNTPITPLAIIKHPENEQNNYSNVESENNNINKEEILKIAKIMSKYES